MFLLRFIHKHIDFSQSAYVHNRAKIDATCLIHGPISRRPDYFMMRGCPECGKDRGNKNQTLKKETVLSRFKNIHGNIYEYDMSEYKNTGSRINIKCVTHGWFNQSVDVHLRGRGCKLCNQIGFKRSQAVSLAQRKNNCFGTLYLIKCFNSDEVFYKVGITTDNVLKRFSSGNIPYDYRIVSEMVMSFDYAYDLEKLIHKMCASYGYNPKLKFYGSARECFTKVYFNGKIYE